jgi:hypothetical protein
MNFGIEKFLAGRNRPLSRSGPMASRNGKGTNAEPVATQISRALRLLALNIDTE